MTRHRSAPYWLNPANPRAPFPPVELALREPDGLLAVGGGLEPERLLNAYRHGIFPWYSEGQPILWWSPDPRTVLFPEQLKVSRSLRKTLRQQRFDVSLDTDFTGVIRGCAEPRQDEPGTWITTEIRQAYEHLHRMGLAHSVETWQSGHLVGGLYGVALGRAFFGESMFSRIRDASKVAFVHLVRQLTAWGFALIDCQVHTRHLASLGAVDIPRRNFIHQLEAAVQHPHRRGPWRFDSPEGLA
ncbi:MAG TPA: leucyl/phenylalanyl-tRNA--protein transferase [Thiohalobacter sp.]|nr:leucyl/phenylalanyl-tRNA--protein transferase [Thiohalobacter sp.]